MENKPTTPASVDEYIAGYPEEIQKILQEIRATVRAALPEATETIKYQMPMYVQNENLISFAAYKSHIGMYPAPGGTEEFLQELAPYKTEKSTLRFPLNQPIPYDLIRRIVANLSEESRARVEAKKIYKGK